MEPAAPKPVDDSTSDAGKQPTRPMVDPAQEKPRRGGKRKATAGSSVRKVRQAMAPTGGAGTASSVLLDGAGTAIRC